MPGRSGSVSKHQSVRGLLRARGGFAHREVLEIDNPLFRFYRLRV